MKAISIFIVAFIAFRATEYDGLNRKVAQSAVVEVLNDNNLSEGIGATQSPDIDKYRAQFKSEFSALANLVLDYPVRMKLFHSTVLRGRCYRQDTLILINVRLFQESKTSRFRTYAHEIAHMKFDHGAAHTYEIESILNFAKEARLIP